MIRKNASKISPSLIGFAIILVFAILLLAACNSPKSKEQEGLSFGSESPPPIALGEMFYNEDNFSLALVSAKQVSPQDNIQSIIVPHHLVASEYIAKLNKMASGREVSTIVIIGPNHEDIGTTPIASGLVSWQTPEGNVETDRVLTQKFLADLGLKSDPFVFASEHSIGAQVPFIRHYFPDAKILPIVFTSFANKQDTEKVSDWLSQNLPKESLIIFSIDFSHYFPKNRADKNDELTQELIENRDVKKIFTLGYNDYFDSPATLATALMYANSHNLKINISYHGNSFDFLNDSWQETTSYFGITFTK